MEPATLPNTADANRVGSGPCVRPLNDDEIRAISIAVRDSVTRPWSHPDWNYMYYDHFERAVANGIRLALAKAGVPEGDKPNNRDVPTSGTEK